MKNYWSKVEDKATQLLADMGILEIPIPIEMIARNLNTHVSYEPFDGDLSGVLYKDKEDTIIGVNSSHPLTRQRFTIAHEIGHLILHEPDTVHIDKNFRLHFRNELSSQATDIREIEANAFAAAILMPANLLRSKFDDVIREGIDIDSGTDEISSLAREFQVSSQALMIRLSKLGMLENFS